MGLSARVRHYWSRALTRASTSGRGRPTGGRPTTPASTRTESRSTTSTSTHSTSTCCYTWNFAPGSELTLGWKNSIYTDDKPITEDYFTDLGDTLSSPQTNSLSLKVLYYIDVVKPPDGSQSEAR